MNTKTHSTPRPLPTDVAEAAFLDINDFVAAVRMSASWVHEEVRAGRAPAPVIRQSRCTRWLAADIKKYLKHRAEVAVADAGGHAFVLERAKKASAKGREAAAVAKSKATRKARIEARDVQGNRSVEAAA